MSARMQRNHQCSHLLIDKQLPICLFRDMRAVSKYVQLLPDPAVVRKQLYLFAYSAHAAEEASRQLPAKQQVTALVTLCMHALTCSNLSQSKA
jgi:hypothetical protein